MKKIIWLIMGTMLLTVLSGCGKKESGESVSKDYVYKTEELSILEDGNNLSALFTAGEKIYVHGMEWGRESGGSTAILCTLNKQGKVEKKTEIKVSDGTYYNSFDGSDEGNIYCLKNVYSEDASDPNNIIYSENFYLVQMEADGKEKWSVCLNEIEELNTQDYFYVNSLKCLPGQKLVVGIMENYAIFDESGSYQGLLKPTGLGADENSEGRTGTLVRLQDGRVIIYRYGDEDSALIFQELNMETGALGEESRLTGNIYSFSIYPGAGYDLFLSDSSNVYGYNLGAEQPEKLMNYVDSDLLIYNIYNMLVFSEEEFWGMVDNSETGSRMLARFTKIAPQEVPDKINITLAGNYVDWNVKNCAVKFNKTNDRYRIKIIDYGELYNTSEDYQAGVTKLNADIVSGKCPDILNISYDFPIQSYMTKGLFADLKPFIEADEELSMDDLAPNVVEAYSMNGKYYQLTPSYSVMTAYAKTADVGSEPGWTIHEAQSLLDSKPEGTLLFDQMTQSSIMYQSMYMGGEQFIDWEKGKCHYNSQAFIDLLEFAKTFPTEIDYSAYDNRKYWEEQEYAYRNGEKLVLLSSLYSLTNYNRMKKATFGEEITMIGFPSETGMGSALNANLSLAMSAKSKAKDGAWEFLRYFLTEEYQDTLVYDLPISIKRLDELCEEAMKKPTYEDENGNVVETDDYYYLGDQEFLLEPMSDEEVKKVKDFIYSVDSKVEYNDALMNIILEEAAPFFENQKSAKEVADIIQSRVQIYVSENS